MISKLSAKYQFCAIHTADNTDDYLKKSIVSEKSPSFRVDPPVSDRQHPWFFSFFGMICFAFALVELSRIDCLTVGLLLSSDIRSWWLLGLGHTYTANKLYTSHQFDQSRLAVNNIQAFCCYLRRSICALPLSVGKQSHDRSRARCASTFDRPWLFGRVDFRFIIWFQA